MLMTFCCVTTSVGPDNSFWNNSISRGSQQELAVDNPTEFKGKAGSLRFDHEKKLYYLALAQEKFISSMQGGKVEKKKYDQQIDPSDLPEYRSVGGCLQWLSGRCRPDVAATTSLCSKGTKATYKGLALMYQAVEHLHATKEMGINMFPTTINENSVLVSFSDSSWANAEGFASQHCSLTLIADPRVLDSIGPGIAGLEIFTVEPHLPLYSSCRSQHCRCECGYYRSSLISRLISELIFHEKSFQLSRTLRFILVTDCRCLHDVLCSENPKTEDKRTFDGFTKHDSKLLERFVQWLQGPWIQLREVGRRQRNIGSVNISEHFHLLHMPSTHSTHD